MLESTQKLFEPNSFAVQVDNICKSLNHSEIYLEKKKKIKQYNLVLSGKNLWKYHHETSLFLILFSSVIKIMVRIHSCAVGVHGIMSTICWNADGIIKIDDRPPQVTIREEC